MMVIVSRQVNAADWMADNAKVMQDIAKVRDYVKESLFQRSIFIFDEKEMEETGMLYVDFVQNCGPKLMDGMLKDIPEQEQKSYQKFLWMKMKEKKMYHEWLAIKRSNAYQAQQDKFHGKSKE